MANPRLPMSGGGDLKREADQAEAPAVPGAGKTPGAPREGYDQLYRDACEHAPAVGIDGTKGKTKMPAAKDGRRSWRGGK